MKRWAYNSVFQGRLPHMIRLSLFRWMFLLSGFYVLLSAPISAAGQISSVHSISAKEASTEPPAIVIGFVGGFIKHDNPVHSEVQLAARLRKEYPAGVEVETFESDRETRARQN